MSGPARGRRKRAMTFRALLACLALITLNKSPAAGPNADVGPVPPGPRRLRAAAGLCRCARSATRPATTPPIRAIPPMATRSATTIRPHPRGSARFRPTALPAASGASDSGFNSLNRTRKKPKFYPGQAKPKPPPGPGTPAPWLAYLRLRTGGCGLRFRRPIPPTKRRCRRRWPARSTASRRASASRSTTIRSARSAITSAASSSSPRSNLAAATTPIPAVLRSRQASPFWVVAPEFLAVSDWERHALVADLRGSFTGYGNSLPPTVDGVVSPSPTNVNRPDFTGHVDGRLDVTEDTRITSEARLRVSTDNPGSPNIQAGLPATRSIRRSAAPSASTRISTAWTLPPAAPSTAPSIRTPRSPTAPSPTNDDRNFNQYGGIGRVSYELTPALKAVR